MKHIAPQFEFPIIPPPALTLEAEVIAAPEPVREQSPALFLMPPSFKPKALKPQTNIKGELI